MKRTLVAYPFLLAMFPVLSLYAHNIDEVVAGDLLLPVLFLLVCTSIPFFLFGSIFKDYNKGAIATTCFLVLFFSFGYARDLLAGLSIGSISLDSVSTRIGSFSLNSPSTLWFIGAILLVVGASLIRKSHRITPLVTKFLSIVAVVMLVIPAASIGLHEIKSPNYTSRQLGSDELLLTYPGEPPDIYYIILDGYASSDILTNIYGYDNSEFYTYLDSRGFYVACDSHSNYAMTELSVASSLNMDYWDVDGGSRLTIGDNKVKQLLESIGYRFIYITSSSIVLGGLEPYETAHSTGLTVNSFTNHLLGTTALAPVYIRYASSVEQSTLLGSFAILSGIPYLDEPTFVFAHILSPHPPYLFDKDGNAVKQETLQQWGEVWLNKDGYIEMLIFTNKKVQELVNNILARSATEPIIILQADHGSASTHPVSEVSYEELSHIQLDERMSIFNAYLLPQNGSSLLYDSITPVNSFRVVLNRYFGTDYEMLEDESYFSNYSTPYEFHPVYNREEEGLRQ